MGTMAEIKDGLKYLADRLKLDGIVGHVMSKRLVIVKEAYSDDKDSYKMQLYFEDPQDEE